MEESLIIIKPLITEKSLSLTKNNWYSFSVSMEATKGRIKKEVEQSFKVDVLEIKTIIVKGKTKKVGKARKSKKSENWKKAFVKIKPDQKIPLFEEQGA